MKRRFNSLIKWIVCGCLAANFTANAQDYPFPQNVDYAFGYKPNGANHTAALAAYNAWKTEFVTTGATCGGAGALRVKFDRVSGRFGISGDNGIVTVSEGTSYGMLLSAYVGDKALFDGLWNYYKKFDNGKGISNWAVNNNGCGLVGFNGATDAELDVAWALWVAYNQFGGNITYLNGAKALISAIKAYEIDQSGGLNTLKPGDAFGGHSPGNDLVNPSYFSPAYYRVFGEITNDAAFWTSVYNRGYDILEKITAKNASGLVPDWSTSAGTVPAPLASTYDGGGVFFFYDAVRAPVRTALDYLWYGDDAPRALTFTKKINNWLRAKHPNVADIGSQYNLAGDKTQAFHNNTFVGAFAVSAMATDDQTTRNYLTSLYSDNVTTTPQAGEYFNASWKAISLFILTGNFYLPPPDACDGPELNTAYHLCEGIGSPKAVTLTVLTGASKYVWKKDGTVITSATTNSLIVNSPGAYDVTTTFVVDGKNCVRRASTIVYPAAPTASFLFTRTGTAVDFKNTSTGGDLFSTPATLTSAWSYGAGATPATGTTANGATNYGNTGLKVVTLTVTNKCGNTSSFTEQIPLPTATGPGWFGTNFTTQSQGLFSAFTGVNIPNTNVSFTYNCQFAEASVKKAMDRYETVAITFKNATVDAPLDVTAYPYARFRIKIESTASAATLLPNGLRVDLVDNTYKASGGVPANIVYLRGPRNADGTYQNVPLGQWFVSTLSFEGKMSNIDATKVLQLAFTPYNDLANGAVARTDYKIAVDWVTVGNKEIPAPNPTISETPLKVCEDNPVGFISGAELDSCNSSTALWNDGVTTFGRTVKPGSYTVTVSNFAGSVTKNITVQAIPKANVDLTYVVSSNNPFQIQPYDKSVGEVSSWRWHRTTTEAGILSLSYNSTAGNTFLYNTTLTNPNQFPLLSPTGTARPASAIFTGTGPEFLCLVIQATTPSCVSATRKCIPVVPTPLGIEEYLNESTFKVYPTFVGNTLYMEIGGTLLGNFEVQISNMYGSRVMTTNVHPGVNQINLDSGLASGTYIVTVKKDGKSVVKRFIKE